MRRIDVCVGRPRCYAAGGCVRELATARARSTWPEMMQAEPTTAQTTILRPQPGWLSSQLSRNSVRKTAQGNGSRTDQVCLESPATSTPCVAGSPATNARPTIAASASAYTAMIAGCRQR